MDDSKVAEERVPRKFVIIGGISFLLAMLVFPWTALIGIADGIYILKNYPTKHIHGIIPIILNFLALLPTLIAIGLYLLGVI